jgi:hypothetical protein
VNEEETKPEPTKPMMKWCERDLQAHKEIVIVLLYPACEDKKEEKESANYTSPPYEAVP